MKKKPGFTLRDVCGEQVIIADGKGGGRKSAHHSLSYSDRCIPVGDLGVDRDVD